LALPSPRDPTEIWKKDLKVGIKRPINIALYGNGNSEWSNLQTLVNITRREKTYHIVEFNVVEDFDELTVAEQATVFNLADAVVMASGDHLSNAIFSPDDTYFAEVGCSPKSLIGNPHFMSLIAGTYRHVSKCPDNQPSPGDKVCVSCDSATDFSMTEKNFRALLDDIILKHEQKVSFMSDS
jgi:capsular polysaccharide biosynthesis protein